MAAEMKFMRRTVNYTCLDYENNLGIIKELSTLVEKLFFKYSMQESHLKFSFTTQKG
jgi:hypothetical protein